MTILAFADSLELLQNAVIQGDEQPGVVPASTSPTFSQMTINAVAGL